MTRRAGEWLVAILLIALSAAAVWSLVAFNRRTAAAIQTEMYVPRKTPVTPEAKLLQEYVRIDTSNPPGNEIAGARFLARRLESAGVRAEIIEPAPGRASVYARLRGTAPGGGLMLLNHIDVVPPKGKWTRRPFSGAILLNQVYGRGSIDMKGLAICQLEAFLAVARAGRAPQRDLVFLATADEETGGRLGVEWLLANRPDVFEGVEYALGEGGITEMRKESLTFFGIETGSNQITHVDLVASERSRLDEARLALEPHFDPRDPARVLPGVRRYFSAVAATRIEAKETLTDVDATIAAGKFWLIPETYRFLLTNSLRAFGPRRLEDGTYAMAVYLFNLPDENPDRRLAWLTETVKPFGVTVGKVHQKQGPAPISADDTPLFALLRGEVRRAYGNVPSGPLVLAFSSNDSRFLRARGITCYGFQPFRVDFFQSLTVHGVDERVRVDWFTEGVVLMKHAVSAWVMGSG